jgi:polar amino acid transport system substrate-binding protein
MVLGLLVAVVCALGKTMGELHQWINTLIYFIKNNGELDAIHRKWLNAPLPELPVF